MLGAPAGSAPTSRGGAGCPDSQATAPASSPPPPTGSTSTSGSVPSCAASSDTTVPCPAMVRGSSKAGISTASVAEA